MAAFFKIHLLEARARGWYSPRPSSAPASRRASADFREVLTRVRAAAAEVLIWLWMTLALGFWLLVLAGLLR